MPETMPRTSEKPTEQTAPAITPEAVTHTIEAHGGLLDMKNQACKIFEYNQADTDTTSPPEDKADLLEAFKRRMRIFRHPEDETDFTEGQSGILKFFPDQAERDAIVERMIRVAETSEGYIEDTEELKQMNDEAREIAVFDDEDTLNKQNEKTKKREDLDEKLNEFDENSPLSPVKKRVVIDTIIATAETSAPLSPEDEPGLDKPDDEAPTLDPRGEARRQENMARMQQIDAADRMHGYGRVIELSDLAIELNGVDLGFGDLGVEAAKRIHRSKTRGKFGQILTGRKKDSDYVLHGMAVNGNNLTAANAMASGGYLFNRSIDKGRNDALHQLSQRTTPEQAMAMGEDMQGLWKTKNRYNVMSNVAEQTANPDLIRAVSGLYNIYRKQEVAAKLAISIARRNNPGDDQKARKLAAKRLKFPGIRDKTLQTVNRIIAENAARS